MKLFPKFLLSFAAVALLAVLVVALLANQAAQREVGQFMIASGMTTEGSLAAQLGAYYQGHGSWEGVEALLDPGRGMGRMMGQRLILADAGGRVVVDTAEALTGQRLAGDLLAAGTPVEAAGQRVGTLVAAGGGMHGAGAGGAAQQALLQRVNRAIWLAALLAGAAAVIAGGALAYGLARPVRALTAAAQGVARGALGQRVVVAPGDEVGELGAAFNVMAASLERAERLRREMTADLAHELRNPIAVLQGNLEAVLDGVLPPTPENLQPMLAQTQLLARLVDDLRTLALADAGQLSLRRAPADPAALAAAAVAQFQPAAGARPVALSVEAPPGLPAVHVDAQRLGQVLGNLLSNALAHTPPGGRVVVRLAAGGPEDRSGAAPGSVTFSVADTGPGIPPGALPHIFDRFYRAERGQPGGTGLGLTIARKLVEAHGGRIWARNEGGAVVSFTVPAA
jgi:signal transduction histidine kinase